jgi:hypothetical protein
MVGVVYPHLPCQKVKTEGLKQVLSILLSSSSLLPNLAGKLFQLFPSEDLHVCYRIL